MNNNNEHIRQFFATQEEYELFIWAEKKIVVGAWNRMEQEMLPDYHIAFQTQCYENAGAYKIYSNGLKKIQGRA